MNQKKYYLLFIVVMILMNIGVFVVFSRRLSNYVTVVVATDNTLGTN